MGSGFGVETRACHFLHWVAWDRLLGQFELLNLSVICKMVQIIAILLDLDVVCAKRVLIQSTAGGGCLTQGFRCLLECSHATSQCLV